MPTATKIDARSYYDTFPNPAHRCGDIWRNLPTFGLFPVPSCSGIVITPACDLSWQKSNTMTYLPIIPMRAYFSLDAALPLVVEKVNDAIKSLLLPNIPKWETDTYVPPQEYELEIADDELNRILLSQTAGNKIKDTTKRALAGIKIIRGIRKHSELEVEATDLFALFGSEWRKIKERIIRNNFSPGIHFLPNDTQDDPFSGVNTHSIALFRYPITVPIRILNIAQETNPRDWDKRLQELHIPPALQLSFSQTYPIKLISLRNAFLSDLLTRFSALYNRIGSPDFSNSTVATYANEVDK
ncbi:hypothetical protein [Roseomonas mucosa]|uniref:hypothetical protein n=1 Tax=Roseomonas mucosa TaxID=207340 RepID=UPI000B0A2EA8|nr:hypothetical protein [Roseomonas mucosa]